MIFKKSSITNKGKKTRANRMEGRTLKATSHILMKNLNITIDKKLSFRYF